MTKFTEIPVGDFPVNFDQYTDLMDQIRNAARGFERLRTAEGRMVDKDLMEVWTRLGRTWELIQYIQSRELADGI